MKNTNKKGFTLVELVIVIAVIAILAGVLIGTFATVIASANKSKALQEWKATVDEAYVVFMSNNHEVPGSVKVNGKTLTFGKNIKGTDFKDYIVLTGQGYIELSDDIYLIWDNGSYSVTSAKSGSVLSSTVGTTN